MNYRLGIDMGTTSVGGQNCTLPILNQLCDRTVAASGIAARK